MTHRRTTRGPVGLAALKLKDALTAKLEVEGPAGYALNPPLIRAINLVARFIYSEMEDASAFEALKGDVRKTLLKQPDQPKAGVSSSQMMLRVGRGAHAPGRVVSAPGSERCMEGEYLPALRSQAHSAASGELDFTLPTRFLASKAFVRESRTNPFERLAFGQDMLAKAAERQRRFDGDERKRMTREMYGLQLAEVSLRRKQEADEKMHEHLAAVERLQQMAKEDLEKKQSDLEKQAWTRGVFKGQVDEALLKKRTEEEQSAREAKYERSRLAAEERADQRRQEEQEKANTVQRAAVKAEIQGAIRQKELDLIREQDEERQALEVAKRLMDAAAGKREADVAIRAAKLKAAYERGGGAALCASQAERAKTDADRAERLQAEYEAEMDAKMARDRERRRDETQQRVSSLKGQMADREAARKQEAEDKRQAKLQIDAQMQAQRLADKEAKAAGKVEKAERLAYQRTSMILEQKKRYHDYVHRIPLGDQWVHMGVLDGKDRGFVNLSVPAAFPSTVHTMS